MLTYNASDFILPGLPLHIFLAENENGAAYENTHRHNFLEIVYILNGNCTEIVNDVKYVCHPGDMLFINYNSTHKFTADKGFDYINIIFAPETVSENIITSQNALGLLSLTAFDKLHTLYSSGFVANFKGEKKKEIENILFSMLNEINNKSDYSDEVLTNYLSVIICNLIRKMSINFTELNTWEMLLNYISTHIDEKLTLKDLANKCFYNPSYFSRIFKEKFKINLVEYIAKERCKTAVKLLESTNLSTVAIAEQCGFNNKSGFYRTFREFYGCTPGEYRKSKK